MNFSVYFLFQATLGKKLLLDYYRIPAATAATFTFAMMLVTIACLLLSGLLSRALGNRRRPIMHMAVACMLVGAALLCGCLRFGLDYRWVLVSYCLLGMTSLSSPLHSTLLKEYNPPDAVGTAVGLSNAGCYLAVALVTGVAGWIMDRFAAGAVITDTAIRYPRKAYLLIAGLCLLLLMGSGIATLFVSETHGRQQPAESSLSKDQGHAGLITS